MKISSLIPKVRFMLGNRSDIDDQIAMWIADAVLNLSINFPFSELQVYGNTVQFVANQSNYTIDYFTNCEADDLAFIDTWWYWYAGTSGAGGNATGYGAGGGGASDISVSSGSVFGGNGSPGIVIVTEFISA